MNRGNHLGLNPFDFAVSPRWPDLRRASSAKRKHAVETLASDLDLLSNFYCQEPDLLEGKLRQEIPNLPKLPDLMKRYHWPPIHLLKSVEDSVMLLVASERKKPPSPAWEAFELLHRRRPSLRLVLRVNNLVKHAIERLEEKGGESVLNKAARNPDSLETEILLRQLVANRQKFADLLKDHDQRHAERLASVPLLGWLCKIGHPDVQKLVVFRDAPASTAKLHRQIEDKLKAMWKRKIGLERVRRHRAKNLCRKSVT